MRTMLLGQVCERAPKKPAGQGDLKGKAQARARAGRGDGVTRSGSTQQSPPPNGSISPADLPLNSSETVSMDRDVARAGSQPPAEQKLDPDNVKATADQLQALDGAGANKAIHQQGEQLNPFAARMLKTGWVTEGGLSAGEQQKFFDRMAGKLSGANLARLQRSFAATGRDHANDVARAVATDAPSQTRIDFVRSMAPWASDNSPAVGADTTLQINSDTEATATVLASLHGPDAQQAFAAVPEDKRQAVFNAAVGLQTHIDIGFSVVSSDLIKPDRFNGLLRSAASIPDPDARSNVMGQTAQAIEDLDRKVSPEQLAPLANATIQELGEGDLSPPRTPGLRRDLPGLMAIAAKGEPRDLATTVNTLSSTPRSEDRDAALATLFLKTEATAYQGHRELPSTMGHALAKTQSTDPAAADNLGNHYTTMLGTVEGRALLSDSRVDPTARLWAASQVAADPQQMQSLIAGHSQPWETTAVAELAARGRVDAFVETRGNAATTLQNDNDICNFVSAGLHAAADLPDDGSDSLEAACEGRINCFKGNVAVEKASGGIIAAQGQMGGGAIKVSVLPIQFSSQNTGPISLQLYKADGAGGQSRYIDNTGRVHKNFDAWKAENELPPGKMTVPANGQLGAPGETRLDTTKTPNVSDTFWKQAHGAGHVAALVGGVAASGVILPGSGGVATPVVATAWGVAAASAAYTAGEATMTLVDRSQHGQTLSMADPHARAACLNMTGSALTVSGMALDGVAAAAGSSISLARMAGVANAAANHAHTAAMFNQAVGLNSNWDKMNPTERTKAALQIAFWGGMKGVSAHSAGHVLHGYSFRQQMLHASSTVAQPCGTIRCLVPTMPLWFQSATPGGPSPISRSSMGPAPLRP